MAAQAAHVSRLLAAAGFKRAPRAAGDQTGFRTRQEGDSVVVSTYADREFSLSAMARLLTASGFAVADVTEGLRVTR